jgi:hypothetical protein
MSVAEPSASTSPASTVVPTSTIGFWWISVPAVGRLDSDLLGVDVGHGALVLGQHHVTGVDRRAALHPGSDQRGIGDQQGHGLTLHVRAHQRAVGVVVLEERDHRRGHRPDLLWRHVDQIDLVRRDGDVLPGLGAAQDLLAGQTAGLVERRVRLGDQALLLLRGVEVQDLVGDLALAHHAVRGGDEAVL